MQKKNVKRILSVKLIHETDTDPDTSYLGEYSNQKTSEYSIDRKHSLDCPVNSHANDEHIEKLERMISYLEREYVNREQLEDWQVKEDSQELLREKQDELEECDCDEQGDMERNEYRYFNPSFNYVMKDDKPQDNLKSEEIKTYVRQDYERMESLNRGNWQYIGIRAKAEVQLTRDTVQRLSSGGLWGIESDSDRAYLEEIEKEELAALKTELTAIGFSKRAIATAYKTLERDDE